MGAELYPHHPTHRTRAAAPAVFWGNGGGGGGRRTRARATAGTYQRRGGAAAPGQQLLPGCTGPRGDVLYDFSKLYRTRVRYSNRALPTNL